MECGTPFFTQPVGILGQSSGNMGLFKTCEQDFSSYWPSAVRCKPDNSCSSFSNDRCHQQSLRIPPMEQQFASPSSFPDVHVKKTVIAESFEFSNDPRNTTVFPHSDFNAVLHSDPSPPNMKFCGSECPTPQFKYVPLPHTMFSHVAKLNYGDMTNERPAEVLNVAPKLEHQELSQAVHTRTPFAPHDRESSNNTSPLSFQCVGDTTSSKMSSERSTRVSKMLAVQVYPRPLRPSGACGDKLPNKGASATQAHRYMTLVSSRLSSRSPCSIFSQENPRLPFVPTTTMKGSTPHTVTLCTAKNFETQSSNDQYDWGVPHSNSPVNASYTPVQYKGIPPEACSPLDFERSNDNYNWDGMMTCKTYSKPPGSAPSDVVTFPGYPPLIPHPRVPPFMPPESPGLMSGSNMESYSKSFGRPSDVLVSSSSFSSSSQSRDTMKFSPFSSLGGEASFVDSNYGVSEHAYIAKPEFAHLVPREPSCSAPPLREDPVKDFVDMPEECTYNFDAKLTVCHTSRNYNFPFSSKQKGTSGRNTAEYLCSFPGVSWNTRMQSWLVYYEDITGRKSKTFNPKRYSVERISRLGSRYEKLRHLNSMSLAMHCACAFATKVRYRAKLYKQLGLTMSRSAGIKKPNASKLSTRNTEACFMGYSADPSFSVAPQETVTNACVTVQGCQAVITRPHEANTSNLMNRLGITEWNGMGCKGLNATGGDHDKGSRGASEGTQLCNTDADFTRPPKCFSSDETTNARNTWDSFHNFNDESLFETPTSLSDDSINNSNERMSIELGHHNFRRHMNNHPSYM